MGSGASSAPSITVDTGYVQSRLGRVGALMAAVSGFIQVVQAALGEEGLGELRRWSYWLAVISGLCWAALWLACKLVPMRARTLRIVEAVCIGGAVSALAVVGRLSPVEMFGDMRGPELGNDIALSVRLLLTERLSSLSVLVAMALAMAARAALVPTSPRHTALLTGGVGIPLILVWLIHLDLFTTSAGPGMPEFYRSQGAGPGVTTAMLAAIWWLITIVVCYVISRVVHGLRVEVLAARKLGQYTLEEKLGEGGMGEVYRARHGRLRRPTAVKLLPVSRSSEQAVKRFEAEVQLTAALTHPNTITIFDYGRTDDGIFYYAMELLPGATVGQVVSVDGSQPAARVIKILEQAAGALQEAHAAGLIHRDIKPANIMLTPQGIDPDAAKVLDFGLVRPINRGKNDAVTQDGNLVGTPQCMAPEAIIAADSVGPLSDIYALGAVGYFLLTGTHVFSGANLVEMCGHHLHTEPETIAERLGQPVAGDLESVVMQCLAKHPEDRPQGAAALITLLRRCQDHGGWTPEDSQAWWERNQLALDDLRSGEQPAAAASAAHTFTVST